MLKSGKGNRELLNDYAMLDGMSRQLAAHQRKIFGIGKRLVERASQSDISEGLIDNLDMVIAHMKKAQKEIETAKRRLKKI
ncbi:MAG: hypothetical protein M1569_03150 [Candidatus Marsarchaeota archaeon]|nr:hypothetical protein [Candidatus Marsarchaeota archaeon]MCL5413372.1 hypothetical protein [Candidatus Marsarchaeota archaeon]